MELFWVTEHCGVLRYEKPEKPARAGSASTKPKTEPGIKISLATVKAKIYDLFWQEMDLRLTNRDDCKVSQTTLPDPNKGKS